MPASSEQQRRLFGLALSVKRGETPRSKVTDDVLKIVDSMSEKEIKKFTKLKEEKMKSFKEFLNEEEYDAYREYKAGMISKDEYDEYVKNFNANNRNEINWSVFLYFKIPFNKKDELRKTTNIRWAPTKKRWWLKYRPKNYRTYLNVPKELFPYIDYKLSDWDKEKIIPK